MVKPRRMQANNLVYQHDVTVGYASGAEGWMDDLEGAYWSPVTQLYSVVCVRPKIVYVVILLIDLEECAIIVS